MKGIKDMINRINRPQASDVSSSPEVSPTKSVNSSGENQNFENTLQSDTNSTVLDGIEGFLCPLCFTPFPNADDLQTHYSSAHSADINSSVTVACSVCKMRFGSEQECDAHFLRHHSDPKTKESLDTSVQKELEKIGARLELPSEELELLKSQINAMEESKALIAGEVLLLRNQLTESNHTLKDIKAEKEKLQSKYDELEIQSQNLNEKLHSEMEEKLKLKADLQIAESDKNQVNSLKNELNNLKKCIDSISDENSKLIAENRNLQQQLDKTKLEKDKFELRLNVVEEAKNELQAKWKLKEAGDESEANSVQELTIALENLKVEFLSTKQILEETKKNSKDEINRYIDLLMKETNEKKDLQLKLDRLSSQLVEQNNRNVELLKLNSVSNEERQTLLESKSAFEALLSEKENTILELQCKLESLESNLKLKEEEIDAMKKEMKLMEEKFEEQSSRLTENEYLFGSLQKSLDEMEKKLVAERNRLRITISEHESELKEQIRIKEKLESDLNNKDLELKEFFEKFITSEESRKEMEKKLLESVDKYQDIEANFTSLQQTNKLLRSEFEDLTKEKEMLKSAMKLKMETLQKQEQICLNLKERLNEVEEECLKREHALEVEVKRRNESIEKLEHDLKRIKVQTENSIKQFDDVLNQKMELETRLSCVLDEKMSLFEKCRDFEEENEKLKAELIQVKIKLEDTVAALHELGRENQVLQVEQTKLMSKRWTEDDEVKNCISCNKQFSIAVRKHHCRHCLQIFCNECSSKTVTIPSHSSMKPVRVCDSCYVELSIIS